MLREKNRKYNFFFVYSYSNSQSYAPETAPFVLNYKYFKPKKGEKERHTERKN